MENCDEQEMVVMVKIPPTLLLLLLMVLPAWADDPWGQLPTRGSSYQQIKTWHEKLLESQPSPYAREIGFRSLLETSPIGTSGVKRRFGRLMLDPSLPGIEKQGRLMSSNSLSQRIGATRTLLYANHIGKDPRFELLGVTKPVLDRRGRVTTDTDLMFRHKQTGMTCACEVKEVGASGLRSDSSRIKSQIRKLAKNPSDLRCLLSRKPLSAELIAYSLRKGVVPLDRVNTGKPKLGEHHFSEVLDRINLAAIAGVVHVRVTNILLAIIGMKESAEWFYKEFNNLQQSQGVSALTYFEKLGPPALGFAGSLGFFSGESATLTQIIFKSVAKLNILSKVRILGRTVGWATLAADAFILAYEWSSGKLNIVEVAGYIVNIGAGMAGIWAGAKIGGAIGSWFGPAGTVIGGFLGGVVGCFVVTYVTDQAVAYGKHYYYHFNDRLYEHKFREFLRDYYAGSI